MDTLNLDVCDRCGHAMNLDAMLGDYFKFSCPHCGWVREGLVARLELCPSRQPLCTVVVRWNAEQATFKEIGAARQLFPELKTEPIRDLRARIGSAHEWLVGEFLEIVGQRRQREAAALGLELLVRPPSTRS
jgi:hypothetical protein